ncbi:glyoxylase-like metal-dependent hydrolase (beta-lactamase superfamily II) [Paenibacillus aceris]|uniref:Glyoxylase-like metal-dependent hydrolase (Beta-lactamase superfamily II) n=2 Tax=Paenibacillus aceris TaxID=869555 RepID=A0ABS4I3V3_9BACL|nr:glyoxylase-like metal-dependent hydrolase (beta-lactamase superfamily II) [Paenibacillus aceris]
MMITQAGCSVYPIVVPNPYSLRTFNFYLFQEAGLLTLIDAGVNSEECWEAFLAVMAGNGFVIGDLGRIVITHSHPDHIGIINRIIATHDIPIYAHHESIHRLKREEEFSKLRIQFFQELYQNMGCGDIGRQHVTLMREAGTANRLHRIDSPIIPLYDGAMLSGLRVIETAGHSPDHIVLGHLQRKWLFAGDLLISHMSSNALIEPDRAGQRLPTLVQHMDSLHKCLGLEMETVFSGHGEPIYHFKELISRRLQRIYRRADKICQLVASGISIPSELAAAFFKELYRSEFPFVISEIIGYLDLLEKQNRVYKKKINQVWHYYIL